MPTIRTVTGVSPPNLGALSITMVAHGPTTVANNTLTTLATTTVANGTTLFGVVTPRGTTELAVTNAPASSVPPNNTVYWAVRKTTGSNEHALRVRHRIQPAESVVYDWILYEVVS